MFSDPIDERKFQPGKICRLSTPRDGDIYNIEWKNQNIISGVLFDNSDGYELLEIDVNSGEV